MLENKEEDKWVSVHSWKKDDNIKYIHHLQHETRYINYR